MKLTAKKLLMISQNSLLAREVQKTRIQNCLYNQETRSPKNTNTNCLYNQETEQRQIILRLHQIRDKKNACIVLLLFDFIRFVTKKMHALFCYYFSNCQHCQLWQHVPIAVSLHRSPLPFIVTRHHHPPINFACSHHRYSCPPLSITASHCRRPPWPSPLCPPVHINCLSPLPISVSTNF